MSRPGFRLAWGVAFATLGGLMVGTAVAETPDAASPPPAEAADAFAGAEACAACHQAEYNEWKSSKHAGAFSPTFAASWNERGQNPSCLICHTTGFRPEQGAYAFAGVSCESCHGPMNPGHPENGSMILPTDATACMPCHRQTYMEWKLSGHAQHNIRCFDCHAVHRQGLRKEHVEDQCGACHAERLEDFAHATHHVEGLTCATCHLPHPKTSGIGGTGAPAHSFFVGAETCAACHEETVHRSHKLKDTLGEQVERLNRQSTEQVGALQTQVQELELSLDIAKARMIKAALGALLVGLLIGLWGQGMPWRRRGTGRDDQPPDHSA